MRFKRQVQSQVGMSFHRRLRLAEERQPYRFHDVFQLALKIKQIGGSEEVR